MNQVTRRGFLRLGGAGFLGAGLAPWLSNGAFAEGQSARAKSLILVWLSGGPATIDMWDMKPDAPEAIRGEFGAIGASLPGAQICEHLPELAKAIDRCTLVRSLSHSIADHGPGAVYVMTGNKPSAGVEHPSLGSVTANVVGDAEAPIASYITLGDASSAGAGYLGAAYNPFELPATRSTTGSEFDGLSLPEGISTDDLNRRAQLQRGFDDGFLAKDDRLAKDLARLQSRSVGFLRSDLVRKAVTLADEAPSRIESYGRGELGENMLVARRLIEHGARFVTVGVNGWDTHQDNFGALRGLLPPLDRALAALLIDLDERGLLDETIVCCLGEFGRTPQVNRTAGRDHWSRAMSVLLAGGGIRRGCLYGETDRHGGEPISGACTPADLAITLLTLLGIDTTQRLTSATGRPMRMFSEGAVIRQIIG